MASLSGIQTHNLKIYLSESEKDALEWIEENTSPDSIILSSPEMGLFIPAQTGRRVIYGHPYETINALEVEMLVSEFYTGILSEAETRYFIEESHIDFMMVGPRERSFGTIIIPTEWLEIYRQDRISIYKP